jgi:PAS domain S-box-containing protein
LDIKELEIKLEKAESRISSLSLENETLKVSLKESELLHKAVVENSLDGTIIINTEFDIEYSNDEVVNITGYSIEQLNEMNIIDLSNEKEKLIKILNNVISNRDKFYKDEISIFNKDKELRYLIASFSFTEEFQSSNAIIIQILDITDIKAAELRQKEINKELEERVKSRTKQLEKAMEELQDAKEEITQALEKEKELNSLKTRFISMISHEYRTPLTVILTSTYLIEQFYEGVKEDEFNKFINKIRTSVNDMTQLLEDVLTIGRNESGKAKLIPQKIDILRFLQDIIEEVKVVDKEKHKFEVNYSILDEVIISDEKSLKHIFQNLLTNACKYSPDADLVKIDIEDSETKDDYLMIKVTDFGIGIPEEDLPQLFETFHRADNVGSIQGTGLGLAIVKRSVEGIYGDIKVTSKMKEGTQFIINIPKNLGGYFKTNDMITEKESRIF